MLSIDTLLIFFTASIALGLAPGPDNIFVLTQSALHGRMAGLVVTLGLCTGLIVHTTAVAIGVAAIFQTSMLAFTILKLAGAAYLLYLAWQALNAGQSKLTNSTEEETGLWHFYQRGVIMNLANPKVAIFFLAFLPQFTNPAHGDVSIQIFLLGGLFMIATLLVFGSIALCAGLLGEWLKHSAMAQKVLNGVAALVFFALAVRLATAQL